MKVVFTDLDGTLLDSHKNVSSLNRECLHDLGDKGVCRVAATGRSIYSAKQVMEHDFPMDYLIFSSGAGIMNLHTHEIILKHEIVNKQAVEVIDYFADMKLNFMIHDPIPENHYFEYIKSDNRTPDFQRRLKFNDKFATRYQGNYNKNVSQLLAILNENQRDMALEIRSILEKDLSVVWATSPIDGKSIWLEIFPKGIDKGSTCNELLSLVGCNADEAIAVGNDYNDLPMLELIPHSYVVDNSPTQLKNKYHVVASNDRNGFNEAVNIAMSMK